MRKIRIINKGLLSTLQDAGRFCYQQFGMPVSGAMDVVSLQTANRLVGNAPTEACLETSLLGPEIEFLAAAEIAVCGAETEISINGQPVSANTNHEVKAGDILKLGTSKRGLRNYLAIAGGFDVPLVMGSKSTYLRGKLGGFEGRALQNGDELLLGPEQAFVHRRIQRPLLHLPDAENEIRFIPTSEASAFTQEGLKAFLSGEYSISPQSDRMGYRLSGPKIAHKSSADILSSGIANGSIQVPSHGEPIIMLADRQTVGGYTKIGNVISVDLPLLGQMRPGEKLRFREISTEKAQQLLAEREELLKAAVVVG